MKVKTAGAKLEGTPYEIVQFLAEQSADMPDLVSEYMLAVAVRCLRRYGRWIDSSDPAEFLADLEDLGVITVLS